MKIYKVRLLPFNYMTGSFFSFQVISKHCSSGVTGTFGVSRLETWDLHYPRVTFWRESAFDSSWWCTNGVEVGCPQLIIEKRKEEGGSSVESLGRRFIRKCIFWGCLCVSSTTDCGRERIRLRDGEGSLWLIVVWCAKRPKVVYRSIGKPYIHREPLYERLLNVTLT